MQKINLFWFRRDLRTNDNHGLYEALKSGLPVLPIFIFDTEILNKLSDKQDARVNFIHSKLKDLKAEFEKHGSSLKIIHSKPLDAFKSLINEFQIDSVYTNADYEPYGISRDAEVKALLEAKSIGFRTFNDHVIFEPGTILKPDHTPYTVFTPYSKKWKAHLENTVVECLPSEKRLDALLKTTAFDFPELAEIGFEQSNIPIPEFDISKQLIVGYEKKRDFPATHGTSKLGVHLRFGTISIREVTRLTRSLSEVFLGELIWRNFFIDILWHFPQVVHKSFKPKYDRIEWRNNEAEFELWCKGKTGYPMVDAGMRELNTTGFMHNRVRMVVASFLTKHLLIDWRWGEAWFAEKLLDFELASNNGNWQWAAGCGCDAAPYFRVFNPEAQQKKFDPKGEYILKWVPEYGTAKYAQAIVGHKFARERVLKVYKEALK